MIIHYNDAIISASAWQVTCLPVVCSTICSGVDQSKHESSASLDFVRRIHGWPVDASHKGPVAKKNASIWWCHYSISWIWDTEIFLYINLPYLTQNCSWLIFPDLLAHNCKIHIRQTTNARFNLAFNGQKIYAHLHFNYKSYTYVALSVFINLRQVHDAHINSYLQNNQV